MKHLARLRQWHKDNMDYAEMMHSVCDDDEPMWKGKAKTTLIETAYTIRSAIACGWRNHDMMPVDEWGDGYVAAECARCGFRAKGRH